MFQSLNLKHLRNIYLKNIENDLHINVVGNPLSITVSSSKPKTNERLKR